MIDGYHGLLCRTARRSSVSAVQLVLIQSERRAYVITECLCRGLQARLASPTLVVPGDLLLTSQQRLNVVLA